jgi:tripartite ATP-independent transporter DctM subunit
MSEQLVDFSRVLVGHLKAGLAHASVVCSMILSGVSGSSTADASAIAQVLVPTMKQNGYKAGFAAALIATAGTIGAIIPPSMTMVVYGAIAQVSIGGLFLGGILPGLLIGFFLMGVVKIYTYHPAYPELRAVHGSFEFQKVLSSLKRVWPALLGPLVIVGGILGGIFTATEAGVVACLYAYLVGAFWYRKIRLGDLRDIFVEAAITTTMVSAVIAISGAMGWLLAYMQFNDMAVAWVTTASKNAYVVLLVFALVMILLGTFVDSLAILLVFAPVAVELCKRYGIDPIQMGLVMVICNQIGAVSPPTAPLLFVTTNIAKTSLDDTTRHVWPFFAAECLALVVVIFVPGLSTWIPRYFLG